MDNFLFVTLQTLHLLKKLSCHRYLDFPPLFFAFEMNFDLYREKNCLSPRQSFDHYLKAACGWFFFSGAQITVGSTCFCLCCQKKKTIHKIFVALWEWQILCKFYSFREGWMLKNSGTNILFLWSFPMVPWMLRSRRSLKPIKHPVAKHVFEFDIVQPYRIFPPIIFFLGKIYFPELLPNTSVYCFLDSNPWQPPKKEIGRSTTKSQVINPPFSYAGTTPCLRVPWGKGFLCPLLTQHSGRCLYFSSSVINCFVNPCWLN